MAGKRKILENPCEVYTTPQGLFVTVCCGELLLPLPTCYFRKVFTVLVNVLSVLNKLVAHLLVEVSATVSKLRKILDSILYKVETVYVVLYAYIERCGDGTFFFVAANVHETVVVTSVS